VLPSRWWVLESEVLGGEHIVVIPLKKDGHDAAKALYGLTRYYGAEIEELCVVEAAGALAGRPRGEVDDFLREVHRLKKELGAWVVPGSGGMTTAEPGAGEAKEVKIFLEKSH
jgi:hypothetical protein